MSKHVAVLMGGWSVEREVSLNTGAGCAAALESVGYRVTRVLADGPADLGERGLKEGVADISSGEDLHRQFNGPVCRHEPLDLLQGLPPQPLP